MTEGKYRVAFATGSRADYGIVRNYLKKLDSNKNIELSILTTGALLEEQYGHAIELIEKDGFKIETRVDIALDSSCNSKILKSMSVAMKEFGEFFENNKYDLLIVLGDRFEMLPVCIAAAIHRIKILHIHGGEATFGNYDEFIRHAITKMSDYHFTATEEYRKRVIQLGENPEKVFCLGALGAENCMQIDEASVDKKICTFNKPYYVVLFHPETLSSTDEKEQIKILLKAIEPFTKDFDFIFIGSNADTNSDIITRYEKDFAKTYEFKYAVNVNPDTYHYLVKNSCGLIGNSSSGLIEAPSLGVYTINIGERQAGRVRGMSVIDVNCDADEINEAIKKTMEMDSVDIYENPYYLPDSAEEYYNVTLQILEKKENGFKHFYDVEFKI